MFWCDGHTIREDRSCRSVSYVCKTFVRELIVKQQRSDESLAFSTTSLDLYVGLSLALFLL